MLANTCCSNVDNNFHSLLALFRSLPSAEKLLISVVSTIFEHILVMPATNAISERSFSALRRMKTYLRSTMTQRRLNNIMVLHVHKEETDQLSLVNVANDFTQWSDHRKNYFARFHIVVLQV